MKIKYNLSLVEIRWFLSTYKYRGTTFSVEDCKKLFLQLFENAVIVDMNDETSEKLWYLLNTPNLFFVNPVTGELDDSIGKPINAFFDIWSNIEYMKTDEYKKYKNYWLTNFRIDFVKIILKENK